MRSVASMIFAAFLAAGCSKEQSFDEAFNQQAAGIDAKADGIQNELSIQLNAPSAAPGAQNMSMLDNGATDHD